MALIVKMPILALLWGAFLALGVHKYEKCPVLNLEQKKPLMTVTGQLMNA